VPFNSNPYTPIVGQSANFTNPAQSSGTGQTTSAAVVIANNSPYVLNVGSGEGGSSATIYPYTRDVVPLDPEAGQQITVTPIDIGQVAPSTVVIVVFLTWYQAAEPIPQNLPISIGNTATTTSTQQVLLGTATAADPPPGEIIIPTNPLWRSIWVLQIGNAMPNVPPVCQGASGAFYEASTPPYLVPIAGEQYFYRFNIIPAAEDEVGLSLVTEGALLFYWGADLADTDVFAFDQNGGSGGMSNTPNPIRFSYAGDLVAGTSDDTDIPGAFVDVEPGSTGYITRLWGLILGGTSVNVTVRVNSAPAYAGPVAIPDLTNITITPTPGGFVLPTPQQVYDLDYVDIVLSDLVDTPAGLGCFVGEISVPS
jgi:hypothetical protein